MTLGRALGFEPAYLSGGAKPVIMYKRASMYAGVCFHSLGMSHARWLYVGFLRGVLSSSSNRSTRY